MASINKKFTVKNGLRSETGDVLIEDGGVLALSNTSDANSIVMNAQTALIAIGADANTSWQLPVDRGTNDGYFLQVNTATGAADWAEVPSGSFTISDGTNTDQFVNGETLTFEGAIGEITTLVTDNKVTFSLADTDVTAGDYGSSTAIPVLSIDEHGRITGANTASIATALNISAGTGGEGGTATVDLLDETLEFFSDQGINVRVGNTFVEYILANTAVTAGDYGSANTVATFSVDAQGRLTSASDVSISITQSQISDLGDYLENVVEDETPQLGGDLDLNTHDITGTGNINITGDIAATANLDIGGDAQIDGKLTVGDSANADATSVIEGAGTIWIDPTPVGGNAAGKVIIKGDFQVDGTTTSINSTTLDVEDLNITVAKGAVDAAAADGAGLTVDGANATFTYNATDNRWVASPSIEASIVGNADTATKLANVRTISLTGDATGSADFDGSANASITVDITADYIQSIAGNNGIVVTNGTGSGVDSIISTANTITLGTTDTALRGHKATAISAATQYEVSTQTGVIGSKIVFGAVDASDANSRHMIEVMVLTDGTDTHITQYGEVFTAASLFTLGGGTTAGDITITPASGKTINIKVVEQTI
jgi:hypothetical protein